MTATFWSNFSKRQNSTLQPSGAGTSYTVYLKDSVSILSPVFLIDGIDLTVTYCRWNGRYYFVRDIILSNNNIYQVSCEIDALATWKTQIGASSQYVLRSASSYDGKVVDMFYPMKKDCSFVTTSPTTSDGGGWATGTDGGVFVVGVISDGSTTGISQGSVSYIIMAPSDFKTFATQLFTESNWTNFQQDDRYSFNPIQYIASVMWYPKNFFGRSQVMTSMKIGWQSIGGLSYVLPSSAVGENTYNFAVSRHPQAAARGEYLDRAPYSQYRIVFPPFGDMDLDPDVVAAVSSITVTLKVDLMTGNATLIGRAAPSSGIVCELFRRDVQLGVSVRLSQIAADRIGAAAGAVGSVGSFIGNILTGNIGGAITGAVSGIASAYQSMFPSVSNLGSNDSLAAILGSAVAPVMNSRFYVVVDEELSEHGRPLCQIKQISTLSGFVMCANAELALPALPSERDEIIALMNDGFFYE